MKCGERNEGGTKKKKRPGRIQKQQPKLKKRNGKTTTKTRQKGDENWTTEGNEMKEERRKRGLERIQEEQP